MTPLPPLTPLPELDAHLASHGYAVLDAAAMQALAGAPLPAWCPHWDALPPDAHLLDGGRYRRRRHGCFVVAGGQVQAVPPRAHWQPLAYNALHGGLQRWFEPLPPALVADPAWTRLLAALAAHAARLRQAPAAEPWYVEAHPFRIDTHNGIGRPTPEGAHRDGVDLVVVVLMARQAIKGGETRVFDAAGPQGMRFTLAQPGSALWLDDARVIHETTPIQPLVAGQGGHRDTLVLTLRRGGFQGPEAT